jgi:hypothetical protein
VASAESASVTLEVVNPIGFNRSLPLHYAPDRALTVRLDSVAPGGGGGSYAYAIEEFPPEGWIVGQVGADGTYDSANRKVKFGPFFDFTPRTLTYTVIPPAGEALVRTFRGIISADGYALSVGGATTISPPPPHPADINPSDLTISANEVTAYGAAWRKGALWTAGPNPIPLDYVTRAGFLWKNGESYTFDPGVERAPLWWVNSPKRAGLVQLAPVEDLDSISAAVRILPNTATHRQSLQVRIRVTPQPTVTAYALEERVSGAAVLSEASDFGEVDPANQVIRWGPFFDSAPRELTYLVSPGNSAGPALHFAGLASFDGTSGPLGGSEVLPLSVRIAGVAIGGRGELLFSLGSADGQSYAVELSTDLENWSFLTTFINHDGQLRVQDPFPAQHKFYRLVAR